MNATYQEIEATPSPTGGRDGGLVHRLYAAAPAIEEFRKLRSEGWKPVNFTTGHYANTKLLKAALAIHATGNGLVFVR